MTTYWVVHIGDGDMLGRPHWRWRHVGSSTLAMTTYWVVHIGDGGMLVSGRSALH
jgi:hypothetical protein